MIIPLQRYIGAPQVGVNGIPPTIMPGDVIGVGCRCARHLLRNTARYHVAGAEARAPSVMPPPTIAVLTSEWTMNQVIDGVVQWFRVVQRNRKFWRSLGSPAGKCTLLVNQHEDGGVITFRISAVVEGGGAWTCGEVFQTKAAAQLGFMQIPRNCFMGM